MVVKKRNIKPSILVCVTNQYSCGRLIEAGARIAKDYSMELKVFCALKREQANNSYINEIEYLFSIARKEGAEMSVYYRDDAINAVTTFIYSNKIEHIVVGEVDDIKESEFISSIFEKFDNLPVSIVSKQGDPHLINQGLMKAAGS